MKKYLAILLAFSFISPIPSFATSHQTDPLFGPNVFIFDPSMDANQINNTINQLYNAQKTNEFGDNRYALLFKQGRYGDNVNVDVKVGYYMQVLGLGESPDDVVIKGAVRTQDAPPNDPNHPDHGPGALINFWRSCENLSIIPTLGSLGYPNAIPKDQNVWAVSQAAPLRRVHINGSLRLFEIGYSSGGFLANSKIDNQIISGSQQQWFTRNSNVGTWIGGVWNMVFVGDTGAIPADTWPNGPYTIVAKTPVIREKPFLFFDTNTNQYAVRVPNLKFNVSDIDWTTEGTTLPISNFYIAQPANATAATINAALAQNKHVIFTPGVYHLDDSIRVTHPDTVILGLGLPTLIPDKGQPAMIISDVDGVKLGGVLFDAGALSSPTLLQVGEPGSTRKHDANPTFLYDIFCRIGGAHAGQAANCVTINSNNVIGDYFWLWRADHGANVGWTQNKADNGLTVNGSSVTIYGLMVEHFQKYQTTWNGEDGKVYFYQSEIPYDPPSQAEWMNGNVNGYASYKISNNVNMHQAWGLGVYSFFRDANNIFLQSAIEAPVGCGGGGIQLNHMIDIWLDGNFNTGISHLVNDTGNAVNGSNARSTLTTWP